MTPEPRREQTWEHEYEPRQAPAEEWGFHEEGDPALAGAASRGAAVDGSGRGGVLGRFARHPVLIAVVVLVLLVLWFLWSLFQPFHGDGSGKVAVTIPKGSSVSEVGELLAEKGVIEGVLAVRHRRHLDPVPDPRHPRRQALGPLRRPLHAQARHELRRGDRRALQAAARSGSSTVTIPEGYSRSQAAQLVEEDGVPGSYTKKTVKSKYLDPAEYGGKKAKNLEGFLFPDTFELKPKAPVGDLVQLQLEDFKRKIKKVNMKYAKSKNLTVYDVVTIASMIEREAGVAKQRKLVSSVIYNRLHEGMPLGIDATIRFATGNYTKPLTAVRTGSQLALQHPHQPGPAAGADQQPRAGRAAGGRAPGQDRSTSSTSTSRTRAANSPSPRPTPNSKQTSPPTKRRAKRTAATSRPPAGNRGGVPRLAVIGYPVGHSRSPAMQNAALAALGLAPEWSYEAIEVAPEGFEARVAAMAGEGFAGANVTIPHKEAALALADERERGRARRSAPPTR